MSRTRLLTMLLTAMATLTAAIAAHGAARLDAPADERWQQALAQVEQLVASSNSGPGIVIGITDRERLRGIVAHGYADLKTRQPVTAQTRFAIGSLSKSFTAVALLQMADEGKFDPAAPVSRYLPQFRVNSPYPAITGRSLLNHTSGLPGYLEHLSSMRYALYALHDFQPRYAPGEHFEYSNTGYQILGYVAERIDGDAFPAILERRVLTPLGMQATQPQMDDGVRQSLAVSYERWPYDGSYVEANWFAYTAADGGIVSTAGDLCAYVRFMLNRGATPTGRILSPAAFEAFITPALDDYGYGVSVSRAAGKTVVGHSGSIHGFSSYFEAHLDEGFGLTFMSNAALDWELMGRIIGVVSTALGGNGQPGSFESFAKAPTVDPNDTSRYEGAYRKPDGTSVKFSKARGGALRLEQPDGTQIELTRMGRDIYGSRRTGAYLFFSDPQHPRQGAQEVSNGADWYAKEGVAMDNNVTAPPQYRAYVGRYLNHSAEGPDVRVVVRRGHLVVTPADSAAGLDLEAVGPALFRPASEPFSPEQYQFDTIDDGMALRLQATGVPLYRVDMP